MKFTHKDLLDMEVTMGKLHTVAEALLPRESTDFASVRALSYLVAELRCCARLAASADREIRLQGFDRLDAILVYGNK
jgi:hypothetical protein